MKGEKQLIANLSILIVLLLLFQSITFSSVLANKNNLNEEESLIIDYSQTFSDPVFLQNDDKYYKISIDETNSYTSVQGGQKLPFYSKTFEFAWGTEINDIKVKFGERKLITLPGTIQKTPVFKSSSIASVSIDENILEGKVQTNEYFPTSHYNIIRGVGLNKLNKHVLYISFHFYPGTIYKDQKTLEFVNSFQLEITYKEKLQDFSKSEEYDLLIITPIDFKNNLTKLVEHKNSYGMNTTLVTLSEIYKDGLGRDNPEKIKYFIKDSVENTGIKYVLLVGEMNKLPIRWTDAYPWKGREKDILSDLYYADIYNESYSFCSWDKNENNIFGEVEYKFESWPPETNDLDGVDLYPDVHVGRLACRNTKEVDIVVDKIINYEKETYDSDWFKRITVAGGDTFPPGKFSRPFIYEGEITNKAVLDQLPDFEHIKLWATKRNLNALSFNRAINKGTGFLTYAGHGFEHGWGTYRPNALRGKMGITALLYYTPFIQFLRNEYKLPIIFFDACLTAKLDFNITDMAHYYDSLDFLIKLSGLEPNTENHLPSFAWCFLIEEDGGAIGTIGATRSAYTSVDNEGIYAGAGYLDVSFFKAYEPGITAAEMLSQAQIDYLNNVEIGGKDFFTIEEYILLGDPSLRVGGYP